MPKMKLDWSKISTAAAVITGVFGALTAAATAVKTGMEAYEAVKRNLPEKQDDEPAEDNKSRIVLP
jgi:hypothetical protein